MSALRPKADAQSARVRIGLTTAFPKADIQNVRVGVELYGRLWPKADIRTESIWVFLNGCFGEEKQTFRARICGVIGINGLGSDQIEKAKPTERWGRKATGPRFLRRVTDDPAEGPKIAGLPRFIRALRPP